jgi:hypothetical protein
MAAVASQKANGPSQSSNAGLLKKDPAGRAAQEYLWKGHFFGMI